MPLFKCPYLVDHLCMIASAKSHVECYPTPSDCKACSRATPPRDDNGVTVALIKRTFEQHHIPMPPHLEKLSAATKIKVLIGKWASPDDDCGCNEGINKIESWGDNFIHHLDEIEDMLVNGAKKSSNPFIRIVATYLPFIARLLARRTIRIVTRNYNS